MKLLKQHETQREQKRVGQGRGGWVHPEGVNSMARTGFSFRKGLVATLWPISNNESFFPSLDER